MKPTNQKPQQDWEKEFDSQFGGNAETVAFRSWEKLDECKQFISTERQRVLEEAVRRIELALGADQMGITNKLSKREVLLDLLQALNKLEEDK